MRIPKGLIIPERVFFLRDTTIVAKALLGHFLYVEDESRRLGGRIVETEAYLSSDDPACHASRGLTERNRTMFKAGGVAYVYFIYGVHHCLNVVTGPEGKGTAVLIRAIEPTEGIDVMFRNRPGITSPENLANGPGKLTIALGITRDDDGSDLLTGRVRLFLEQSIGKHRPKIVTTTRVGIREGCEKLLRYYIAGSAYISKG